MVNKALLFEDCTFAEETSFKNRITEKLEFKECNFQDRVDLSQPNKSDKKTELFLINCYFEKNVKFHSRIFTNVSFNNTTFDGVADFYGVKFNDEEDEAKEIIKFFKTTFNDNVVFTEAIFSNACNFKYTTFRAIIIYRDATFDKGLNLAHANFAFQSSFSTHKLKVGTFKREDIILEDQRETFRLLKNDAIKNNNKIDSLDFYKEEMNAYRKSVNSNRKVSIKLLLNTLLPILFIIAFLAGLGTLSLFVLIAFFLISPWSYLKKWIGWFKTKIHILLNFEVPLPRLASGDWWILFFQRIFGNFNQSWGLSLLTTLSIAAVFFIVYNYSFQPHLFEWGYTNLESWGHVISDYMLFLWPGREFDALSLNKGALKIPIDILSRVLIGIGLYQTLRSFRKLG